MKSTLVKRYDTLLQPQHDIEIALRNHILYADMRSIIFLDLPLRAEMRRELAMLHETLGTIMIYMRHDQSEALSIAEKAVAWANGQAQQTASPERIYNQPAHCFLASFIHCSPTNSIDIDPCTCASPSGVDHGLEYGIRPERFTPQPRGHDDSCIAGRLERIEPLGNDWQVEFMHRARALSPAYHPMNRCESAVTCTSGVLVPACTRSIVLPVSVSGCRRERDVAHESGAHVPSR